MPYLHLRFVLCCANQIYNGDFAKFCGLLRIHELYKRLRNKIDVYIYGFFNLFLKVAVIFFKNVIKKRSVFKSMRSFWGTLFFPPKHCSFSLQSKLQHLFKNLAMFHALLSRFYIPQSYPDFIQISSRKNQGKTWINFGSSVEFLKNLDERTAL